MRNTNETIQWYRAHETTSQLGYDPGGRCLQICREARGLAARYPSALSAQIATPSKYRVSDIGDIRRGMVVYFDDRNDSNPYGHIVTVVGRVKGADPRSLSSLLTRTNSVVSGRVVVVKADYYPRYWGDAYQFAATWLNGYPLEMRDTKKAPEPKPQTVGDATNLKQAIDELQEAKKFHKEQKNDRIVRALDRDIKAVRQTIEKFERKGK
jgi:hypothetical protein